MRHEYISITVAVVAVILSQLPPLHEVFSKQKYEVQSENSIKIVPDIEGGITIIKNYSILNTGNKNGSLRSIELMLFDANDTGVFSAKATRFKDADKSGILGAYMAGFSQVAVNSGDTWSTEILFRNVAAVKNLRAAGPLKKALGEDYLKHESRVERRLKAMGGSPDSIEYKVRPNLTAKVNNLMAENLSWLRPGNYTLYEVSKVEINEEIVSIADSYTINFEAGDIDSLVNDAESVSDALILNDLTNISMHSREIEIKYEYSVPQATIESMSLNFVASSKAKAHETEK